MPIPLIVIGACSCLAGLAGVGAALEAKDIYENAKQKVDSANERYNNALESLNDCQTRLENRIKAFNEIIFKIDRDIVDELKRLIDRIEQSKGLKIEFIRLNKQLLDVIEDKRANITVSRPFYDAILSITSGSLVSADKPVLLLSLAESMLSVSTFIGIPAFTGALVTLETALGFLGGGAVSAGGLGMTGGMVAMGMATLGLGILVGGMVLNVSAEKAMTEAKKYESQVDLEIQKIDFAKLALKESNKKLESLIATGEKCFDIMNMILAKVNIQKISEEDVKRVVNVIVMLNKFREIITTNLSDKSLEEIISICNKKINEAQLLINSIKTKRHYNRS